MGNEKLTQEQIAAFKESIKKNRAERESYPSGYLGFERGERNVLTAESAKLSSKNFDRLMKERGINKKDAKALKDSFREYRAGRDPNSTVTVRHILSPERAVNYHSKDGASGTYQTRDIYRDSRTARKRLALPDGNDAKFKSNTIINPHLDNGKQHNVLEGTVARQERDGEHFGQAREGGGRQIVTDGGYKTGAVSKVDTAPTCQRGSAKARGQEG